MTDTPQETMAERVDTTPAGSLRHANTLTSQLLPETDQAYLTPFVVEGALAVRALLRELMTHRALLAVYSSRNFEDFVISQVTHVDDRSIELDFVTDDERRRMVTSAGSVVVIGLLETIKVQFELNAPVATERDGRAVLRAAVPTKAYRLQRRDAFRVRPTNGDIISLAIRLAPGKEQVCRVIDFSVSGVAYALPAGSALPEENSVLPLCRLEIADRPPIPCDLLVRHVSAGLLSEDGAHRIGCEFHRLDSVVQRNLQMAVIDLERRQYHAQQHR